MSNEGWSNLVDQMRKNAAGEIQAMIEGALPWAPSAKVERDLVRNSSEIDPGDITFEDGTAAQNLAAAVAAYRAHGASGDVVASHSTGPAFCGSSEGLEKYAAAHDLGDQEEWTAWDDPDEILSMPYDEEQLLRSAEALRENPQAVEAAKAQYKSFHWGDSSAALTVKEIPGVAEGTPLAYLGVPRRIEYGSRKNGEWAEYYHLFGEETGVYPDMYSTADGKTLIIHGGNFTIESDGLIE